MLSQETISKLLGEFGVPLSPSQANLVQVYLELLLRWNLKINLTAIRSPAECVTRHFGESFFLGKLLDIRGRLLDIGSGAGFPGLAIKILAPDLQVTLLEPVAKKRAFLKEAARVCQFAGVDVRGDRLEGYAEDQARTAFDIATARALGGLESIIPLSARCLKTGGSLCLWLGRVQLDQATQLAASIRWSQPAPLPLSNQRVILVGKKA